MNATTPTVRERPILFSGPMVRAILDGRKTVTRRVASAFPDADAVARWHGTDDFQAGMLDGTTVRELVGPLVRSPFGAPGDRLWVRESWAVHSIDMEGRGCGYRLEYAADRATMDAAFDGRIKPIGPTGDTVLDFCRHHADKGGRPSIHMPRWASRLLLDVVSVRVERLQDITVDDAAREGITPADLARPARDREDAGALTLNAFEDLWRDTYGPGSWDANPWVWRVEFRRVEVPR